jgi:chaperonin GroES
MPWGDDPTQIQPLGDRLLVKTITERENRSGIIIPELAQGRPEMAHVLSVGPGARNEQTGEMIPMPVEPGDVVIFHRHAGTHIGGFDDDYIIFREQDILAKVLDPDVLAQVGSVEEAIAS